MNILNAIKHIINPPIQINVDKQQRFSVLKKGFVTPTDAFKAFYDGEAVFYKGVSFARLLCSIETLSRGDPPPPDACQEREYKKDLMQVIAGYNIATDEFVFINYSKILNNTQIQDDLCCICLEPLLSDGILDVKYIAVRVYGTRCHHDMHAHCLNACRKYNAKIASCCDLKNVRQRSHLQIKSFSTCKIIKNYSTPQGIEWINCNTTETKQKSSVLLYKEIIQVYSKEQFVPFCDRPYNETVEEFE